MGNDVITKIIRHAFLAILAASYHAPRYVVAMPVVAMPLVTVLLVATPLVTTSLVTTPSVAVREHWRRHQDYPACLSGHFGTFNIIIRYLLLPSAPFCPSSPQVKARIIYLDLKRAAYVVYGLNI